MTGTFDREYAEAYDLLYQDKDYGAECDLLERIFHSYAGRPVRTVLDLGCGTGGHALILADRGYEVLGVDRSAEMLARARSKADAGRAIRRVAFQEGDIRVVDVGSKFDAVVMMFGVLSYQLENADIVAVLGRARAHLNPGGVLAFDLWYGPAVLRQGPSDRVKVASLGAERVLRMSSGSLDTEREVCMVHYRLQRFQAGRLASEAHERHDVRYFFEPELRLLVEGAGLTLVRMGAFPEFEAEPNESTWNALAVAHLSTP